MKINHLFLSVLFILFISKNTFSQAIGTNKQCVHCNMVIKDPLHKAQVTTINNQIIYFDAIECLLNYTKTKNKTSFSSFLVSDYKSGNLIAATTATYLISDAIKSPMGANLSALKNNEEAKKLQQNKGGKLFNWQEIVSKFNQEKTTSHHHHHNRPDAHAPIGVMGDHLHQKGGFMISLRYMNMAMEGNREGTSAIDNSAIYNSYMVAPQSMDMQMYMLGIMFAPSDKLTLSLMQNLVTNNMDLKARMMMNGMTMLHDFSTKSSGFGDMKLGALYSVYSKENTSIHLNGTLNLPVGNIKQKDDTPMMVNAKLPYAMQLGSGTFDITLGATYKGSTESVSWGIQPLLTFRTGKNSEDYRLGNSQQINFWGAYKITDWVSISGRFLGFSQSKISGQDPDLNPMMVTTADVNNYGGKKIKSFLGFNFMFNQNSRLKNVKIGIEAGAPIYENYNGVQMDKDLSFQIGLKYSI